MNEKIKELSNKALQYAKDHILECETYGYYKEHDEFQERFENEFARLIIQECASWMEEVVDSAGDRLPDGFYWSHKIKEHFGV